VAGSKRKNQDENQFDVEALGLILLAIGIAILGFLIPAIPSGVLGQQVRNALMGNFGFGAYFWPFPFLVVGSLFMLGRHPRSMWRVVVGFMLMAVGFWFVFIVIRPDWTGRWGLGMRSGLAGLGWLALIPAFFIGTIGLDVLAGFKPTRVARGLIRRLLEGLKHTFESFLEWRGKLKAYANLQADKVLARNDLQDLEKDLQALVQLYPGSAEVIKWRKEVLGTIKGLSNMDEDGLEDARLHTKAWRKAVTDFSKSRASDMLTHLRTEGIEDLETQVKTLQSQLGDPILGSLSSMKALEETRKALSLDVTGVFERYRQLMREKESAEASLKGIMPRALLEVSNHHQKRLKAYEGIQEEMSVLDLEASYLEQWRDLVEKLERLDNEFSSEYSSDFDGTLAKEMSSKPRHKLLPDIETWQKALDRMEVDIRKESTLKTWSDVDATALEYSEDVETEDTDSFDDTYQPDLEFDREETEPEEIDIEQDEYEGEGVLAINQEEEEEIETAEIPDIGGMPIQIPPYDMLDAPYRNYEDPAALAQEVQIRVRKIDETLANFKLEGRVVSSVRGPSVTRFEVEPAPGEKISRFANLSDDLALAMAVGSVRIEAPIPGKSVIGLEVPNANRDLIRFREAAESPNYRRSKARLPLILGKSIDSEMVIADLARMPHLLIAGSTGSGKSVAVNTLIASLLYKFLPTELRFLMIDPKMVELTPFDGIPHLLRPVVTNPNDAAGVLLGAVAHMERRYKMMSKIGAKNLDQYNEKARNLDMPEMPFIIIVIDELADLMITSPKEVESAIMRLAQMARATGMHLVLATQRPSVDILTSLIKVNVPARMAFAVSSGHDSRTILDTMGAERLIGSGDMLYYQPGMVKPLRLQGPFVTEAEITNISNFLRRQYFDDEFVEAYGTDFDPPMPDESSASGLIDWNDDKLREAAELAINEGQASVSRFQRRLGVGHARAGKLMDSLEALGVVGKHEGSKPRDVLVSIEDLPNIFGK
jgi:S-DNA-T family DNA segregation ATPase FtsK/SpoIIIE